MRPISCERTWTLQTYKNMVPGMNFLKDISDRFERNGRNWWKENGFEEDVDEYTSEGIFFVPSEAQWAAHTFELV